MSKIEWTNQTWNPIVGCSVTSPGCTNCYAMKMAARIERMGTAPHYAGTTTETRGGPVFTGKVALATEKAITAPLRRNKPTTYFVNSMGDLFHENVPDEWIDKVFSVMARAPQHTFQILTKRAARMRGYMQGCLSGAEDQGKMWPLPNVWLGVSAEDQTRADERIPDLLRTPAAVRFVSAEPLLGSVRLDCLDHTTEDEFGKFPAYLDGLTGRVTIGDFADQELDTGHQLDPGLDWVIVGGESGPRARPMHPDWARSLRDQCKAAGTAFFFKQWGNFADHTETHGLSHPCTAKHDIVITPEGHIIGGGAKGFGGMVEEDWRERGGAWMCATGKKSAGRLLDGREWNEVPA